MTVNEIEKDNVPIQSDVPFEETDGLRLFIGNLDFRVSAPELKEYLAAYNVHQVTIPKRRVKVKSTSKPYKKGMGYGFAQFATTDDAKKALEGLADATWNDRKLTVSFAKPNQFKKGKSAEGEEETAPEGAAEGGTEGEASATTAAPKKRRGRKPKKEVASQESGETNGETPAATTEPKARKRRQPLPLNEESPMLDTAFVTGIPRAATVPDIKEYFAAEEPQSVKISQQNIYNRKEKTKERVNRGFALVKFADNATRDAVIAKYDGKEWEGRVIHVRVAFDILQTESSANGAEGVEASAEAGAEAEAETEAETKPETETPETPKTEEAESKAEVKEE